MSHEVGDIASLFIYLLIIFTLVRPRSQGPTLIRSITDGLVALVRAGTGGGTF